MKNLIIITDINEDPDDLMALVMACALKKQGLVNILGVISTVGSYATIKRRAHYAKGVLSLLGEKEIPVCMGEVNNNLDVNRKLQDNVFIECEHTSEIINNGYDILEGVDAFLTDIFEKADKKSLTIINLAGHTDNANFIKRHEKLFLEKISEVAIMGDISIYDGKTYLPSDTAHNNCIDELSTQFLYRFLQLNKVKTKIMNSKAVKLAPVDMKYFKKLVKSNHLLSNHLREIQKTALCVHYTSIAEGRAESKYSLEWFYKNFTNIKNDKLLNFSKVWPHVNRLYLYDPLTLLMCIDEYKDCFRIYRCGGVDMYTPEDEKALYQTFNDLPLIALKEEK